MLLSVIHAFRVLRKDPGFTAVSICSLAIGIGATAAMFGFANAMLLRPLPVQDSDRVLTVNTAVSAYFGQNPPVSYPDYVDLRDHNRTFEGLTASSYSFFGFSPNASTLPHMKYGLFVSGNFFRVMGVEPALGRAFRPDEDQAEGRDAVCMLGHEFWAGQFAANPNVIGSRIRLNGIDFTVIGVAPESFTGIDLIVRPQIFVPLAMSPRITQTNNLHNRDLGWLFVKGRLKPGISQEQAQADIAALSPALEKLHSQALHDQRLQVQSELQFRIAQAPKTMTFVAMLGLLGICVLLVACANVAGLLLSRARARSREIAVRLAIGASRIALVRQLLLENLLVAVAGGLGGVLVADAMAAFWHSVPVPSDLPLYFNADVDHRLLLFTLLVSVLSTLLFGLAPALAATRPNLVPALKSADADSAGRRRFWGRNSLVAGQVALSLVLLAVSATLVQGFRDQLAQGPGFRIDHLFLTSLNPQLAHYTQDQAQRFYQNLLDRTRQAPGVKSATLVSNVPMNGIDSLGMLPENWQLPRGLQTIDTYCARVSDGYFETMRIPILQGRAIAATDREDAPLVAVVNEQMAAHYWKGDALGKRFHLGSATGPLFEIVGIAKTSKYMWTAEAPLDFFYLPFRQLPRAGLTLVAESADRDGTALAPVLRETVRSLDPDMPVFDARGMREFYTQRAIKTSDIVVQLVAGMGLLGMVLAGVGLYGLVAYSVSRRTREIGLRMALGAHPRAVAWMVLRQGLWLGLAGIAAGLLGAFYICPLITSRLTFSAFTRVNLLTVVAIPLGLLLITMLASWAPAARASRVDPLTSLRDE